MNNTLTALCENQELTFELIAIVLAAMTVLSEWLSLSDCKGNGILHALHIRLPRDDTNS